ncbi:MAG TPA: DEAD/DEAH box helicase [bacterium]|nr:DEAD/DEAH box helicase [bacterium]HPM99735.1 DEAD/DEAH box helicase [bacterium]
MIYNLSRAISLLRLGTGQGDSQFREGQEEAIRHVYEGHGRLLIVQKTGWGKSYVYFIATKMLREAGMGPALLISPLLALMRNQIAAAARMGVRAKTINSDNESDWETVETAIAQNEVDILLISPERLANTRFQNRVLVGISGRISLVVIDEAHCISDWGHDFRPHYRLIERILRTLPQNIRLLATTATANNRVTEDLRNVLGPNLLVSRGDLNRPSLALQTIHIPGQAERLAWLAEKLPSMPGHGIIYTLTVRDAVQVAAWLTKCGMNVRAYTSESDDREALEQSLLENQVKALVATTALGMGFDKPDLAFVIHYQSPASVVAYYQQVGRAGRALAAAYGILLSGSEESEIIDYFIESAFPTREEVQSVLQILEQSPDGLSIPDLMGRVNLSMGRIEKTLHLLSLESPAPVVKQGSKWQLTAARLNPSFWQRAERLTRLRYHEKNQMQEYIGLESDHMRFLIEALDGDLTSLTPPPLPFLAKTVEPIFVQKAIEFLRRTNLLIEPRKKWPAGGMPRYALKGPIPPELQAEPGRALSVYGDAGWGGLVFQGKYKLHRFPDELIPACARLIKEWNPDPAPEWITCIPSLRHPDLVPDFARRLAAALELPFHPVLIRLEERPEQKHMANSVQQARNMDGSLDLAMQKLPPTAVLLIDDMVDSRWTMTVAAWLLRSHGSGRVFPFALSLTGKG